MRHLTCTARGSHKRCRLTMDACARCWTLVFISRSNIFVALCMLWVVSQSSYSLLSFKLMLHGARGRGSMIGCTEAPNARHSSVSVRYTSQQQRQRVHAAHGRGVRACARGGVGRQRALTSWTSLLGPTKRPVLSPFLPHSDHPQPGEHRPRAPGHLGRRCLPDWWRRRWKAT